MIRVAFGETILARSASNQGIDGIGRYTLELKKKFEKNEKLQLVPFSFTRSNSDSDELFCGGSFSKQAIVSCFTGAQFKQLESRIGARVDLVHATDHLVPKLNNIPVVATIMDAIPLLHPEWLKKPFRKIKSNLWRESLNWANHIITISEYSRFQLLRVLDIPQERISVIPLAVGEEWYKKIPAEKNLKVNKKYSLPNKYFLFVGTLQPRKNVVRIIVAHRSLPKVIREEYPLIIIGREGWECQQEIYWLTKSKDPYLKWLKYIDQDDLMCIVNFATALVVASLAEGFGLTVLEAFASRVPVIASNNSALKEVAKDFAVLIDPTNASEIAEAMIYIVANSVSTDFSNKVNSAYEYSFQYSWTSTADKTLKTYLKLLP